MLVFLREAGVVVLVLTALFLVWYLLMGLNSRNAAIVWVLSVMVGAAFPDYAYGRAGISWFYWFVRPIVTFYACYHMGSYLSRGELKARRRDL